VFTLARQTREEEIRHVLEQLPEAVAKLRSFSPVWRQKMAAGGQG
jgi:cysteine sulfinate desulfinase/cysteine desulfurase-like protein